MRLGPALLLLACGGTPETGTSCPAGFVEASDGSCAASADAPLAGDGEGGGFDAKGGGGDGGGDGPTTDTGELVDTGYDWPTTTYTIGEVTLQEVQVSCPSEEIWQVDALTQSWTADALYNVWQVIPDGLGWDEEHGLPSVDFGSDGDWDELQLRLDAGVGVGTFTPDRNTVFQCGLHDGDDVYMVHAIRVYDSDLALADCAIWGAADEVEQVLGNSPNVTDYNGVSSRDELEACVVW